MTPTGLELSEKSAGENTISKKRGAKSGAISDDLPQIPAELASMAGV
jgi:hypothetical protein